MRIQHNISAMRAVRQVNKKPGKLQKLASGFRINGAADDAAGLAISEKMRSQIRGMRMAQNNTQDAVSLIQTADGALTEVHVMLHRMRELAVQASNGTYTEEERQAMQSEVDSLKEDVDRISKSTNYNHIPLLDGSYGENNSGGPKAKATYTADIDFTDARNGSSITIGGTVVEFDTDGVQGYSGSVMVDISSAANGSARAQAFQNAIMASDLTSQFDFVFTDKGNGVLNVDLTSKYAVSDAKVDVTYKAIPDMAETVFTEEIIDPDPASFLAVYTRDGFDINQIVDGMTLKINNVLFEFDGDGTTNNTGAVAVDISNRNRIAAEFEDAFNSTPLSASCIMTLTRNTPNGNICRFEGYGFDASDPITEITFNPPGTVPYQMQGANIKSGADQVQAPVPPGLVFQVGASEKETMRLYIEGSSPRDLGIQSLSMLSIGSANSAISAIDKAVDQVSRNRSGLGAAQNRLEHTLQNLGVGEENLSASESRIRDADMAKEMVGFTKENILAEAAQAMLAQANHQPDGVLQLLK